MPGILPKRTQDYLAHGAQKGQRNDELLHAACQFRDAGYERGQADIQLVPRAKLDGLGEFEIHRTIESAYSRTARESVHGAAFGGHYTTGHKNGAGSSIPSQIIPGFIPYLQTCFDPNEFVAISDSHLDDDGRVVIQTGVTLRRDEWIRRAQSKGGIEKVFTGKTGLFVRINPVTEKGKNDSDVTVFRHVLIESDIGSKEQQFDALIKSNFPISATIDSGGVSIHGLIRVDAQNAAEWRARAKTVYDWFASYQVDPKNSNPARYSRVPDAFRTVGGSTVRQTLLTLKIGAQDWKTWLAQNVSDGMPAIVTGLDFQQFKYVEPVQLVQGIIEIGNKLVIGGPSKARKSWVLIALVVALANGLRWFNFETIPTKTLYLNFELSDIQLHKRISWIMQAMGLNSWTGFDVWNLRGHAADLAQMIDRITLRIAHAHYGAVVIDPIYKGLGGRNENDTGQMTEFMSHIERLISAIQAAVIFSAHFPKGNLSKRYAMDRIAGSGVFARDPDAIITMSPVTSKNVPAGVDRYSIDTTVRNFVEVPSFMVDWQAPLMVPIINAEPDEPKTVPLGRKAKFRVEQILQLLPNAGATFTVWYIAAKELGMGLSTFKNLLAEAKSPFTPYVVFDETTQKYFHNESYP